MGGACEFLGVGVMCKTAPRRQFVGVHVSSWGVGVMCKTAPRRQFVGVHVSCWGCSDVC